MYEPMSKHIPAGKQGVAEIVHVTVSKEESDRTRLRASFGRPDEYVPEGAYAHLRVNGQLMMSDTAYEQRTNREFVRAAKGHVLVAGLGIGMILVPVLQNPDVTSVTVVEKYQDVVDLVGPSLEKFSGGKLKIVCADIFTWKPEKGTRYDTLYFDIWPTVTTDNLKEMATLHRRFGRHKAAGAWMDSWERDLLLVRKRREDKEHREYMRWR